MVEQESDIMLENADKEDVCFLVVGDVFAATTHSDLVLRCKGKLFHFHVITLVLDDPISRHIWRYRFSQVYKNSLQRKMCPTRFCIMPQLWPQLVVVAFSFIILERLYHSVSGTTPGNRIATMIKLWEIESWNTTRSVTVQKSLNTIYSKYTFVPFWQFAWYKSEGTNDWKFDEGK